MARIFAQDWGYLRMESMQIIVSNGYGTLGRRSVLAIGPRSWRYSFPSRGIEKAVQFVYKIRRIF